VHAEELRTRQGQIGLVNQPEPVEEPDVVYGMDGEPIEDEALAEVVVLPEDESPLYDTSGAVIEDKPTPRRKLQRRRQIEEVAAPILEEPAQVAEPEPEMVVMKMAQDVEQMTFGAGRNYDFYRGRRYLVPRDLRDHLDARGLVAR
jgi:hypothetical protein